MEHQFLDPVVEEARKRGQAYTKRFGNDIHAIMKDLKKHQNQHPELYKSHLISSHILPKTGADR